MHVTVIFNIILLNCSHGATLIHIFYIISQSHRMARSHGAIFLFVTAMQKMNCVDVNDTVHMV